MKNLVNEKFFLKFFNKHLAVPFERRLQPGVLLHALQLLQVTAFPPDGEHIRVIEHHLQHFGGKVPRLSLQNGELVPPPLAVGLLLLQLHLLHQLVLVDGLAPAKKKLWNFKVVFLR